MTKYTNRLNAAAAALAALGPDAVEDRDFFVGAFTDTDGGEAWVWRAERMPPVGAKVTLYDMGTHVGIVTRHNPVVEIQGEKRARDGWVQVKIEGQADGAFKLWNGDPTSLTVMAPPPQIAAEAAPATDAFFHFVWTKKGRVPHFAHDTYEAAEAEAERLALINPGRKYIVLSAVRKVVAFHPKHEANPMDDVNYVGHPSHY